MSDDWLAGVPGLAGLDPRAAQALSAAARPSALQAGTVVFRPGVPCERFLIVLDGVVRVRMLAESGREIVLYRVTGGETCIMTTACLMAGSEYAAEGVAETSVRAVAVPGATFHRLLTDSDAFRRFVFGAYGARLADLMMVVQEVAFRRIDVRLARYLSEARGPGGAIDATHEAIAAELGTAREVVSRQLKDFERRGWLRRSRGRIVVADPDPLRALAEDPASV